MRIQDFGNFGRRNFQYNGENKIEEFEKEFLKQVDHATSEFDGGDGDQLSEPDDEFVNELLGELLNDFDMSTEDIEVVISRNKHERNHIGDWIEMFEWERDNPPPEEKRCNKCGLRTHEHDALFCKKCGNKL